MVEIRVRYEGDLHCVAVHGPSGASFATDAPADNQGRGESFSPTDLVATALGTCMLTTMGIAAQKHGLDIAGARAEVVKSMIADPLRRIARLTVVLRVPREFDEPARALLERAALTCPVQQSLSPATEIPVEFRWGIEVPSA